MGKVGYSDQCDKPVPKKCGPYSWNVHEFRIGGVVTQLWHSKRPWPNIYNTYIFKANSVWRKNWYGTNHEKLFVTESCVFVTNSCGKSTINIWFWPCHGFTNDNSVKCLSQCSHGKTVTNLTGLLPMTKLVLTESRLFHRWCFEIDSGGVKGSCLQDCSHTTTVMLFLSSSLLIYIIV